MFTPKLYHDRNTFGLLAELYTLRFCLHPFSAIFLF